MKTIKELMQEYNLTITEFALLFDVPFRSVQKWANGERTPPDYLVKLMEEKLERLTPEEREIIILTRKETWKETKKILEEIKKQGKG